MICKLSIVVCLLVAAPALGSGVKGQREEPAVKGAGALLAPVRAVYREQAVKGHRVEAIKGHHLREESTKSLRREDPAPIKGRELSQQVDQQLPALHREEAVKGRREEPTKGGRLVFAPVEQQRLIEQHQAIKGAQVKLEEIQPIQRKSEEPALTGQQVVQKEELHEQREEAIKGTRVELDKPIEQVVHKEELHQKKEDLHQQKEEQLPQREELLGQQKLEEAPQPTKTIRYEARPQVAREELAAKGQRELKGGQQLAEAELPREQKPWDDRLDLQQQLTDSQQVELKQEEKHHQLNHEAPHSEQRRLTEQVEQVEEVEQRHEQYATKGQAPLVAPPGLAEPYAFDYSIEGSSRRESGDVNGVVRGQYTLQGADGSSRIVDYVADANGFRAQVNTNEAGTESRGAKAPDVPAKPDNWQVKAPAKSVEPLPLSLQQQHIEPQEELTAPKAPTKSSLAGRDEQQQVEWTRLPAKGQAPLADVQKLEQTEQVALIKEERPVVAASAKRDEPLKEILHQQPAIELQESPKAPSAELRSPKTLLRSGFESASAHRPPVAVRNLQARQPVGQVVVRASPAHQVHQQQRLSGLPARQQPPRYAPAALPSSGGAVESDDSLASFERSS